MFCPHCGSKLPDGAKFCQACGHALTEDASEAAVWQGVDNGPVTPKRSKVPLIVLAVLAVVGIGAAVWFFVLGGKLPFGGPHFYQVDQFLLQSSQDKLNELENNQGLAHRTDMDFEAPSVWTGVPKDNPLGGTVSIVFYSADLQWLAREHVEAGVPAYPEILWEEVTVPGSSQDEKLSNAIRALGLTDEFYRGETGYGMIAFGRCAAPGGGNAFWVVGISDNSDGTTDIAISCGPLQVWGCSTYEDVPQSFEFDF